MATPNKIAVVEEYTEKFKQAKGVYLTDYTGIDVKTIDDLRKKFRESNIEYKVLKNRLAKIAFKNAGIEGMDPYLQGVTSFVIGYDDPVIPAKIIDEFHKKTKLLNLKAALVEGSVFGPEDAAKLAALPSREVLLSQFVGLLQAPMSKLVGTLQAPLQKMVGLLESLKEKKQEA
ncbi:50S ribosomal protein L10 [candidate division KSB1 bacterium]|nr:MAG: 50S ribosomal protein L10 [candidate division KSB1 bacterium]